MTRQGAHDPGAHRLNEHGSGVDGLGGHGLNEHGSAVDGLGAQPLLAAWEHGRSLHEVDRALVLLAAASPGASGHELASLSLAERDARLLRLRSATFGRDMAATTACEACGTVLEFGLDADEIRAARDETLHVAGPGAAAADGTLVLDIDGQAVRVRPPTSRDLAAIVGVQDPEEARLALARRCLADGEVSSVTDELGRVADAADDALAWQVLVIELACPSCGHRAEVDLDPGAFLWAEVSAAAVRLLHEVDVLARAYGWRERDILEMTPARRRAYVELAS
jgi:hypothetical protein